MQLSDKNFAFVYKHTEPLCFVVALCNFKNHAAVSPYIFR
jgi:hypothetical protein